MTWIQLAYHLGSQIKYQMRGPAVTGTQPAIISCSDLVQWQDLKRKEDDVWSSILHKNCEQDRVRLYMQTVFSIQGLLDYNCLPVTWTKMTNDCLKLRAYKQSKQGWESGSTYFTSFLRVWLTSPLKSFMKSNNCLLTSLSLNHMWRNLPSHCEVTTSTKVSGAL